MSNLIVSVFLLLFTIIHHELIISRRLFCFLFTMNDDESTSFININVEEEELAHNNNKEESS